MTAKPISQFSSLKSKTLEISVLSLDSSRPVEKLVPGEPHPLAPGITISFLPGTSEGLLEINSEIAGPVQIDGKATSEIATVHPGQIIKLAEGRVVIVRHLQAIIVPKDASSHRSEAIQSQVDAALAAFYGQKAEQLAEQNAIAVAENSKAPRLSRKMVLRSAVGAAALMLGILAFIDAKPKEVGQTTAVATAADKERLFGNEPTLENAGLATTTLAKDTEPSKEVAVVNNNVATPPEKASEPAKKTEPVHEKSVRPKIKTAVNVKSPIQKNSGASATVLSEKDRQTVVEYKLEARFDRSTARAKLKQMSETLPANSPARAEVLKAYNEL